MQVGFTDLVAVAQHYGQGVNSFTKGDFDGDGAVSFADLVTVAQHYGSTIGGPVGATPVSVPEPGWLCVGVGGVLVFGRGRFRRVR